MEKTPEAATMQEVRNAGAILFRMAQTANWDPTVMVNQQAALDWAGQHGMYCWLNLKELSQFDSSDTNTPGSLRNLVDTFRNHKRRWLWVPAFALGHAHISKTDSNTET